MFETGIVGVNATFAFGVRDFWRNKVQWYNKVTVVIDNSVSSDLSAALSQVVLYN